VPNGNISLGVGLEVGDAGLGLATASDELLAVSLDLVVDALLILALERLLVVVTCLGFELFGFSRI